MRFLTHFFFLLVPLVLLAEPPSFYQRAMEGWYWYDDLTQEEEEEEEEEVPEEFALQTLATYKQAFERALKAATAFPTKKNVRQVMELQQQAVQNAEKFAAVWALLLLEYPHLNGQLSNPTSSYGVEVSDQIAAEKTEQLLQQAKTGFALLFVFNSQDPYSHAAARMVKAFEEQTGWTVLGVSLDGGIMPQFPNPRFATDRGKKIGIQKAPAYFAICPEKNLSIPVGWGAISVSSLKQNIFSQLKNREGSNAS